MARYLHTTTVHGTHGFPVDMLRYDACYPADDSSSSQIFQSCKDPQFVYHVTLVQPSDNPKPRFTEARWLAMGASSMTPPSTRKLTGITGQ
jgi:hypothetical protein